MKRKICASLLCIFILSFAVMAFSGCNLGDNGNGSNSGEKQIPVYQGMSITSASAHSARVELKDSIYLANNGNGNNGNHNGHYKGDHADRDEDIDKENPFPDNDKNENIEEEIKDSLNVIGSPDTIYYATPGEDIYINIHIDNPDSFEIMSFTLNGRKYSSYMFEDGSDMETIVLKYNVGTASGIVEYTIDAIKYIDGEEIKDVLIDGDKTVMAGIRTENQVAANVSGVDIGTNALSFSVNVKDNDNLIEFSSSALKAVIYDGFEIVSVKDLALGENTVSFEGLKTNTLYQYAVVGYYDDLSGAGFGLNILYKDTFYTESVVLFDNITVGQEGLSFSFLWHEDHTGKAISALKLYQGNTLVTNLDVTATEIDNLLSNNTYKLVAEYENINTESIYIEFTTVAKEAPEISVVNPTKTKDSVGFEISETDADNVGAVTKIELVHEGGTIVADNLEQRAFANLLSNNAYTVKITYVYNLNDGEGDHTVTRELIITTDAKAMPEISLVNPTKTQTSVGFEISETDIDNVGAVTKIELVHEGVTGVANSLDIRNFDGLLSNNSYTIWVTYVYNLNDGEGDHTVTLVLAITTDAKAIPDFAITNTEKTQASLDFDISVTDTDSVGAITKVELIHGTEVTTLENVTAHEIANLLSNNDYTIKITYTYNLNDGAGNKELVKELTVKTEAKATPEISVVNPTKTKDSVGFEISETDTDNVGAVTKIELVHEDGTVVANSLDIRNFDGLLSNNSYTVRVTYVYNLNDGEGDHTVTRELAITTDAKTAPSFTVKNENITTEEIAAEYDISDVDSILSYYMVELYSGNTLVTESSDKEINFTGLDYYTEYTVKFTYKYDLNDGDGEQTVAYDYTFRTLPYIDVIECNIANTSAVSEGETIFMSVKLDNPLGMTIESVVINGEKYNVTGASTSNRIFVEIVYNGQFAGGDTYLKIDKVNAKIDNTSLNVEPKTELSDNVFINGKLEVLKIEFVNEDFEPIDWAFPSEKVYVMITLNNSTGYSIDSITESGSKSQGTVTNLKKLDNNHWYYELNFVLWAEGMPYYDTSFDTVGWFTRMLESLSYSNDYIAKTVTYSEIKSSFYRVASHGVHYITSPDDLKNMNDKSYYELANDIDLSGLEWLGAEFDGVFDGKGYSIKNMSFVGTIKNSNAYLGLFSTGSGVIQNVNIEEATIVAEIIADDSNSYSAYCGGLIGATNSRNIRLHNCNIDEYSIFTVKNNTGSVYVGGLLGYANIENWSVFYIFITDCSNESSINATGETEVLAGGLVAHINNYSDSFATVIKGCSNSGSVIVSGTGIAGGLIGSVGSVITISNSTNNGAVSARVAGGLIGEAAGGISSIIRCANNGIVTAFDLAGGLVANVYDAKLSESVNNGDVRGTSHDNHSAGLVGLAYIISITNSMNNGSVNGKHVGGMVSHAESSKIDCCVNSGEIAGNRGSVGGLVGYAPDDTVTINNSYSLITGVGGYNGEFSTVNQLNSKEFYTETLGWSEDIWDFSELDVENGKYPKLK